MRIVALEEHFTVPGMAKRISKDALAARGMPPYDNAPATVQRADLLGDIGPARIADMDAAGISLQVLSAAGPGADLMPPADAPGFAREMNDYLARAVTENPGRYAGFAHLPVGVPAAAADELSRVVEQHGFVGGMVNGTTGGLFLDDPSFEPLLARFEQLDVPLYIHPAPPPKAVREIYYDRLPGDAGVLLSLAGWGWHAEIALHILRLVVSGTLDKHPKLKIIIGHMGEGLPAMFARCDQVFAQQIRENLSRPISKTITDQVWVTTSGFFTVPPLLPLLLLFGADRVMFSVDYPFSKNATGRAFLDSLPISHDDKIKIAHGNADKLLKLKA
jgi:predicted TIM-barrel fold metal-dependent hydrolase